MTTDRIAAVIAMTKAATDLGWHPLSAESSDEEVTVTVQSEPMPSRAERRAALDTRTPSELERAEDAECEAQRAAAGRRRVEEAVGRLEAREAVSGAQSAGEWIARWEQLSPGQRFEWAERIIATESRVARAWDEGYAVAHDDAIHSDYCGYTCQCEGIHGQKNPHRAATTEGHE